MMVPSLALVPGEPAGIGPELCVRLAQRLRSDAHLIAYADPDTLHGAAKALSLSVRLLDPGQPARAPGDLPLHPVRQAVATRFGAPDPANAAAVIAGLREAAGACLAGRLQGIVTGPVHKAVINAGGIPYTGTTELLAEQADCPVVMMLANSIVRVALVTTHLPLRAVADAITPGALLQCLRITHTAMQRDFGLEHPRIAVLGLNPHAGEDGHLGREELDIVIPVLERLRGEGMQLIGPLPADTAFLPQKLSGFDAVVAMYHDQGLPVLKYSGFEQAVNITLGLPYPRVAVDHGTALELAGRGIADPSSLMAATELCARLAARR
ncbi:4-hydroxythreonine-4-phosphate dehydrogenase PdxA [Xanthomonas nasturtii]|uniref:4-hydroxythreonine-4-phosphate dehydrogenase n=1 Tax=Xanthomonas nasturtii TaxID=1843581 RepID=A0ABT0LSP2_9XANT|nr:4-hydroxythreonine-4-phosphate dehydrogenase PdxA [Xanthomonas nasturtii]MCL1552366.1 4-hydroxythreonine-4-phosphate dehydrogenase PdxA [Xanthomonas nasturtii]MCL1556660.1 4-hydroxythreonine-4-phosphate dehydrogenase PdxA [Xanthomonas nasturtii]WVL53644.1 4-hydroxythreonine-4-phosphate dehydrogenase PdxA [Xanthomonas nasturtii]